MEDMTEATDRFIRQPRLFRRGISMSRFEGGNKRREDLDYIRFIQQARH